MNNLGVESLSFMFSFLRNCQTIFHVTKPFGIPTRNKCMLFHFSTSLRTLVIVILITGILAGIP